MFNFGSYNTALHACHGLPPTLTRQMPLLWPGGLFQELSKAVNAALGSALLANKHAAEIAMVCPLAHSYQQPSYTLRPLYVIPSAIEVSHILCICQHHPLIGPFGRWCGYRPRRW